MKMAVLLAAGLLAACASAPTEETSGRRACFVIDNTEAGGAVDRIFLISSTNDRIRLGGVPMGQERRHCVRRSNWTVRYWFMAEWAPADRMDPALNMNQPDPRRSESFFVEPGFDVVWEVDRNVVRMVESPAEDDGGR